MQYHNVYYYCLMTQVSDEFGLKDAVSIFQFLQGRGFISTSTTGPVTMPPLLHPGCPLTGVDMIKAIKSGVVVWKVAVGDIVKEGDVLGEIINITDCDAARLPVVTRTSGIVFGVRPPRLVRPGQIIIKVAGQEALPWRQGYLLTA
jgi:predicted deacylase